MWWHYKNNQSHTRVPELMLRLLKKRKNDLPRHGEMCKDGNPFLQKDMAILMSDTWQHKIKTCGNDDGTEGRNRQVDS